MVIPTGTGASIGGFAGDATPYMNLIASVSDVLVTHPNVANAAVFQELPANTLYVEGYALDQFIQGNWALQPVRHNRIGVVFDSAIEPEMLTLHLNTINAAKSVYGLDIVGYVLTREPVETTCTQTPSGCSSGNLKNPRTVLEACMKLIKSGANAIALCTQLPDLEPMRAEPNSENADNNDDDEQDDSDDIVMSEASISSHLYLEGDEDEDDKVESAELEILMPVDLSIDELQDLDDSDLHVTDLDESDLDDHDDDDGEDGEDDDDDILIEVVEGGNVSDMLLDLLGKAGMPVNAGAKKDSDSKSELSADSVASVINHLLEDTLLVASEKSDELEEEAETSPSGISNFAKDAEADYRMGLGVDPIGGLEGILSHLVVSELGIPCAHAPIFTWEAAKPVLDEVVNPRAAAEFIAPTFLPCVLMGLSRAPQMHPKEHMQAPYELISDDVSALIIPANALGGIPVLSALEKNIPVILVSENKTVLDLGKEAFGSAPPERLRLLKTVRSYEEAAGVLQMMRLGLVTDFEPVKKIDLD